MKVWFLSAHDHPRGKSSRTYDFAGQLVRRGHEVTMMTNSYDHWTHKDHLAPDEQWRVDEIDGIRVIWLRTYPYKGNGLSRGLNMISNARRCLQVYKALGERPDVVVGPSVPLGTGWAAMKIAQRSDAAFVFEVRDVWPIALVYDGSLSRRHPIYFAFRYLEKLLYRKADRISATMPYLRDHVRESGGDPQRIVWVPNGVNFDRFKGCHDYDGGPALPLTVMYAGGYGAAHDVISLIRAAGIIEKQHPGMFRYVLIGDGIKKPACRDEAERLGLANVEFRDPVPKSEIPRLQTEADILVACVMDSDAYQFGLNLNKLFDYFASARPSIFAGRAPNDPIAEADAGYSVPPEDPQALADALTALGTMSPAERQACGQRARKYVEDHFDMSILGQRMEAMLQDAVAAKKGT